MKKSTVILLILCLLFSFSACQVKTTPDVPANSTVDVTTSAESVYPSTIYCADPLDSTTANWNCRDADAIKDFIDMMNRCTYTEITQTEYDDIRQAAENKQEHWVYMIRFAEGQNCYMMTQTGKYLFAPNDDYKEEGDPLFRAIYQIDGFEREIFDRMMEART